MPVVVGHFLFQNGPAERIYVESSRQKLRQEIGPDLRLDPGVCADSVRQRPPEFC